MKKGLSIAIDIVLCLALLAGIWLTRAQSSSEFVTWDEPAWVYRSVKFLQALSRGDLAGTMLVGHPGVVTMWSASLSLTWHRLVTHSVSAEQLAAIDALPELEVHDPTTIRLLVSLLPAAKAALPIVHAVIGVVLFLLLKRLLDRRYALIISLLLMLDPYYLGLSRVLHIDALTSGFMLIAIISVLIYTRRGSRFYLLFSGMAAGLATLNKSYGALVVPAAALFLAVAYVAGPIARDERDRRLAPSRRVLWLLRDLALWSAVAITAFVALWPAMWAAPLSTLQGIIGLSLEYATQPGDATSSFFRDGVLVEPGAAFYPTAIFFRTTPLVLVGCLLALVGGLIRTPERDRTERARRPVTAAMLTYGALYIAIITLSRKKFDRYVLPAILSADVLAAMGWAGVLDLILWAVGLRGDRRGSARKVLSAAVGVALIGLQSSALLRPLYPAHYLAYYNPWAGGPSKAVETVPVGWGEGIEEVAEYLKEKPDAEDLSVATWAVAGIAPDFPGEVTKLAEETIPNADYVLLYLGDVQSQTPLTSKFYGVQKPEYVVELNGIEYAWLYRNTYYEQLGEEIVQTAEPGDAIVLNAHSAFDRHYNGDLSWYVVDGATEEEVAKQLKDASGDAKHLFYLEYPDAEGDSKALLRRQLAQNGIFLWEKPFAYGTMGYYLLPKDANFQRVGAPMRAGVDFGHRLCLEGYGLSSHQVEYRRELGLGLEWRALRKIDQDYHLFVHVIDSQGQTWGQKDAPLRDADFLGTSAWPEKSEHLCNHSVPIEPGTPPGKYWIEIGVYGLQDLARLDIIDKDEQKQGTAYVIGPIDVVTPTVPPEVKDLAMSHLVNLGLGDKAEILGYDVSSECPMSGDEVVVTLFWRCLKEMHANYDLVLRLERDGDTVGFKRAKPTGASYPTDNWVQGEIIRYQQSLPIAADAASGTYKVYVNLLSAQDDHPLAEEDQLLMQLFVEHRERIFSPPPIQFPMTVTLGSEIQLLGYDLQETEVKPGDTLHLTLYWRALRPSKVSYTVFTHLLDAQSIVRGQRDSTPVMGQRPTTGWAAGEVIIDHYEMSISEEAPLGPHQVEFGMYDPATGERLSMTKEDGSPIPERRILVGQPIEVRD